MWWALKNGLVIWIRHLACKNSAGDDKTLQRVPYNVLPLLSDSGNQFDTDIASPDPFMFDTTFKR